MARKVGISFMMLLRHILCAKMSKNVRIGVIFDVS